MADQNICGHLVNGGACGLVPGHTGSHQPVRAVTLAPIRTPEDMILAYPGMRLDQARTLLAEADQAAAGDPAETLGVFVREERDPFTRALISGQRLKVTRQAGGAYLVTVTDEAGGSDH